MKQDPICSEDTEPTEQNSQVHESNLASRGFIPKIATDDEIPANIRSLDKKQRMVFDVLHQSARNYVKNVSSKKNLQINLIHIFLSGSGGSGNSHLVKTIYQVVSTELLYHSKEPDKPRVLLLGPTGISAVNTGKTTIHSGLGIKPGVRLLDLSDKVKASLRNKLSEVKMVIIAEFLMVSSDLFFKINARLLEIFMCSTTVEFAGLTVALVADLLQLPPVMGKPVYVNVDDCDSLERHLALNLWHMFQFAELTEIMRQREDAKFIDLLNKIRVGNVDVQKQIRERFIE